MPLRQKMTCDVKKYILKLTFSQKFNILSICRKRTVEVLFASYEQFSSFNPSDRIPTGEFY
jgi:hypothetical protein